MTSDYYSGINEKLLNQVPNNAKKIFEIGCGNGNFGERVKILNPDVNYYAVELDQSAAKIAATKIDHVICGNIETISLMEGDFDCIILGDILEHLYNPLTVLKQLRALLRFNGCILCSIPNVQHHSIIRMLLSGDFQYQDMGLLDRTHIRFFTYASFIKLLLDAGFVPQIVDTSIDPPAPEFFNSMKDLLEQIKQDQERTRYYLSAYQYIFRGTINSDYDLDKQVNFPISFIVPTNDRRVLADNFFASPIFKGSHPHQILLLENQTSAAQALDIGIQNAVHDFILYAHQDVYFPQQWDAIFSRKVRDARTRIENAAIFGVAGGFWSKNTGETRRGRVMDRHWFHHDDGVFPVEVDSLDELLIGFSKISYQGTDPALGFHLYGTDLSCNFRKRGLASVVVDALCFHNSALGIKLPPEFFSSVNYIGVKWHQYLPLVTPSVTILYPETEITK